MAERFAVNELVRGSSPRRGAILKEQLNMGLTGFDGESEAGEACGEACNS